MWKAIKRISKTWMGMYFLWATTSGLLIDYDNRKVLARFLQISGAVLQVAGWIWSQVGGPYAWIGYIAVAVGIFLCGIGAYIDPTFLQAMTDALGNSLVDAAGFVGAAVGSLVSGFASEVGPGALLLIGGGVALYLVLRRPKGEAPSPSDSSPPQSERRLSYAVA